MSVEELEQGEAMATFGEEEADEAEEVAAEEAGPEEAGPETVHLSRR